MLDIDDFFLVGPVADGRKVAVAFVDGVIFGGDGRVDIAIKLLDVRHAHVLHCLSQIIIKQLNRIGASLVKTEGPPEDARPLSETSGEMNSGCESEVGGIRVR